MALAGILVREVTAMRGRWLWLLVLVTLAVAPVIWGADAGRLLVLSVGDSEIVNLKGLTRVATANPEVVEVVVTGSREVLLNAKHVGGTVVNLWSAQGITTYRITVQDNYRPLEKELTGLIDNPQVQVLMNSKYVILNGTVATSLDADQAIAYAKMYRENVINNLNVKTKYQILLSILVTEVKKENENKYGLRWGSRETTADGVVFNEWQAGLAVNSKQLLTHYAPWGLGAVLDAMEVNGDAKVLAAPSILTSNAQEATFLAGGEIPIPIPDGDKIKVEWKEYGVKLKAKPVLSKDLSMTLCIAPEVSTLDWANAISLGGFKLPALATRKASTQLEVKPGATIVIGGLLRKQDSQSITRIPFLGKLPIIGSLFRSKDFLKGETELLFFVTPSIITDANQIAAERIISAPNDDLHFAHPDQSKKAQSKK
jgi:pilus assembly protein CpaC